MESARNLSHDIAILPSDLQPSWDSWWQAALIIALTALALVVGVLVLAPSADGEATIAAPDGLRWTVSDAGAYLRGRLDDAQGRTYCEQLIAMPQEAGTAAGQRLLARLTAEVCARRLAQPW